MRDNCSRHREQNVQRTAGGKLLSMLEELNPSGWGMMGEGRMAQRKLERLTETGSHMTFKAMASNLDFIYVQ